MATTLLLWPEKTGDDQPSEKEKQDAAAGPARLKNRKGGRTAANAPKKQPQRGLGVAQLERLRLQEQRRKMLAEAELIHGQQAAAAVQYSFLYADGRSCPGAAVMVPRLAHPPYSGTGPGDTPPSVAAMQRYRIVSSVRPPLFSDATERGFPGVGAGADPRLQNVFQAAPEKMKELSSNQNMTCWSEQCEACNKRRKPQYENHVFVKEGRQGGKWTDGCDLLRLGLWTSQAAYLESMDRETAAVKRGDRHVYFAMDVDKTVERKGKEVIEGRIWEYEFFPAKNGGPEELKDVTAVGEPSDSGIGGFARSSASASLDLSLKLFSC